MSLRGDWKESSYSESAACLSARFVKSSYSGSGPDCLEARQSGGHVLVRDTKDENGPVLSWSPQSWDRFLEGIKNL